MDREALKREYERLKNRHDEVDESPRQREEALLEIAAMPDMNCMVGCGRRQRGRADGQRAGAGREMGRVVALVKSGERVVGRKIGQLGVTVVCVCVGVCGGART